MTFNTVGNLNCEPGPEVLVAYSSFTISPGNSGELFRNEKERGQFKDLFL